MDGRLFILCPLIFFAGLVDSIAGGGGLISLTAYAACGVPMGFALGTNKFSSSCGTVFSSARYIFGRRAELKTALVSMAFALAGSALGAAAVQAMDKTFLKYMMIAATPIVAVFVMKKKDYGTGKRRKHFVKPVLFLLCGLSGLVIGFYDGFYGPGTGTFFIMVFTGVIGFDLITASGNARLANLASNIAALAVFIRAGQVVYALAVPCAVCAIGGNLVGSGLAIKRGARFIKPVFAAVLALIAAYVAADLANLLPKG